MFPEGNITYGVQDELLIRVQIVTVELFSDMEISGVNQFHTKISEKLPRALLVWS